ncbi:flagellar biosynthetic protein FliO [Bermanella sp. R86510]|uniref:flagellar biosynthetic protein FliO n=1 Tax=unclassified Bermanella TaxID=2627862 RepID=UPI0037C75855
MIFLAGMASAIESTPVSETAKSAAQKTLPHMPDTQEQIITIIFALIAVVALIYAIAWLAKRKHAFGGTTRLPMKTIAVLPMGVKEKIVLIEVGSKQILLGMTPQNINTLATFDEPIIVNDNQDTPDFSHKLMQILSNKGLPIGAFNKSNSSKGSAHED